MRKWMYGAAVAVLAISGLGAAAPAMAASHTITTVAPSPADPLDGHAGQPGGPLAGGVHSNAKTIPNGPICSGVTGGNCWWESAVQLWYNMKNNINEQTELATIYSEYGGDFQDNWTDDNAWWGITWQLAYNKYGVANYHTKAENLWTWDTTPGEGWDSACGGSTYQWNNGGGDVGPENGISRAALGQLAAVLPDRSGSALNASNWINSNLQPNGNSGFVSEGITAGGCTADTQNTTDHPTIGLETEAFKDMLGESNAGNVGARASAVAKNPDGVYDGVFQELFDQYIG